MSIFRSAEDRRMLQIIKDLKRAQTRAEILACLAAASEDLPNHPNVAAEFANKSDAQMFEYRNEILPLLEATVRKGFWFYFFHG